MPKGNLGFFTVDSAGKVTYTFNGRIIAQGVDLKALPFAFAQDPPPIANSIRYLDVTTGTLRGAVWTDVNILGSSGAHLSAYSDPNGVGTASIDVNARTAAGSSVVARASGSSVRVIDGQSFSSFLQLATIANRKIDFGQVGFTWNGGGAGVNFTVAHNLGTIPLFIAVTQANNNTRCRYRAYTGGGSASITVEVFADAVPAAGTADNFWWAVIG